LVDVVPLAAVDTAFTYKVPSNYDQDFTGFRVIIPLGNRKAIGIIVDEHKGEIDFDAKKLKTIIKILDEKPVISKKMLRLAEWLAEYYVTPIGEVLDSIIPRKLKVAETKYVYFVGIQKYNKETLTKNEQKVINFLEKRKSPISMKTLRTNLQSSRLQETINLLAQKGIVKITYRGTRNVLKKTLISINTEIFERNLLQDYLDALKKRKALVKILNHFYELNQKGIREIGLDELQKEFPNTKISKYVNELSEMGILTTKQTFETATEFSNKNEFNYPNELTLPLNEKQKEVVQQIIPSIESSKFDSFLLFGVTGSGKTLIYMHCIKKCLELGKSSIILVPEISLTPQLIERFNNAFPNQVAVLHSRLKETERTRQWASILNGEKKIVIGPRSAIFAPVENLGLIVVDEEHEPTYKQEDIAPRYNARDVALVRGKIENSVVILGSATPSVNSFYAASTGKHKLLMIDERADGAKLPNIFLVNMIEKRAQKKVYSQFSDALIHKIIERLNRKEGVILFQNRRGFGLLVECKYCGYIPKCPECEVSLTYHKNLQTLKCHYCGYEKRFEPSCPKCGKFPMLILGYGTQRIEEELEKILTEIGYTPKIARFDLDAVLKNPNNEILQKFHNGEIDILVGTQLIAKGLDFERVTLVGIINADLQLNIPDYTANERAFQLFTQVAGRAGRRSTLPGEVVIQTTSPSIYPVEAFVKNDYFSFYTQEIKHRKLLKYPPFYRLISVEFQWKATELNNEALNFITNRLKTIPYSIVLGPVTPIIPRVRGWNRKVYLLKVNREYDSNLKKTTKFLKELYYDFHIEFQSKNQKLIIDVDAQFSLL
jgi:primosomal protein N' (replication factor Y)